MLTKPKPLSDDVVFPPPTKGPYQLCDVFEDTDPLRDCLNENQFQKWLAHVSKYPQDSSYYCAMKTRRTDEIIEEINEANDIKLECQRKKALVKIAAGEKRARKEGGIIPIIEQYLAWMRRYVNQYKFLPDSFAGMLRTNFEILRNK